MIKEILIQHKDNSLEILKVHQSGSYAGPATILADTIKNETITSTQRTQAEADKQVKLDAEQLIKDSDAAERDAVKTIDVDNMTDADQKRVLKYLIKRVVG